jgi:hypothetical protein
LGGSRPLRYEACAAQRDQRAAYDPIPETPPTTAVYPGSGFATVPLRIR